MNDLAEHIYELIVGYYIRQNGNYEEWETTNGKGIKKAIRQLLQSTFDPQPFSELSPIAPPPNELHHLGDGIMVEIDNPELDCEVIE